MNPIETDDVFSNRFSQNQGENTYFIPRTIGPNLDIAPIYVCGPILNFKHGGRTVVVYKTMCLNIIQIGPDLDIDPLQMFRPYSGLTIANE